MSTCRIRKFYEGQNVFVTGATGFLGKTLIEKLLRACPEVNKIFIFMRPNKKGSVTERVNHLLESTIFDTLRKENPLVLKKIIPISGELELPSLGLSTEDRQLVISSVSIVIHSAATVRFNEPLSKAVGLNVIGTRKIVELCKEMTSLKSFVHVSTAFSNCNLSFIEERIYPIPEGGLEIMKLLRENKSLENVSSDLLDTVAKVRPNTYTYSKALAEHVIVEEAKGLPVCIFRPSVVTATLKEPVPGWTDNLNGSTGIFAAVGMGILQIIAADSSVPVNIIPVDMTANMILCSAWATAFKENKLNGLSSRTVKVYHGCSSIRNTLPYKILCENVTKFFRWDSPFSKSFRTPLFRPVRNKFSFFCNDMIYQYLPALVHDFTSPWKKYRALDYYNKISVAASTVAFFTRAEFEFVTDNMKDLHENLTEEEQLRFFLNVDTIEWKAYLKSYCRGIRRYIIKEDDSTLLEAHNRMIRMYKFEWMMKTFITACLAMFLVFAFLKFFGAYTLLQL